MSLPLNLPLDQLQTRWKSEIDPVLANLLVQGRLVTGVSLLSGVNVINHGLGRPLVGWLAVGQSAASALYDSQAVNPQKQSTLILNSANPCTVSIWFF